MARYNCTDPRDYLAALDMIARAKEQHFEIEIKKWRPRRTQKQNGYYHFICAYFAHVYGCTIFEAENVYMKQFAARDIFEVEYTDKEGRTATYFKSSADLNTAEMSSAIKNFLAYADMVQIPIPLPDDEIGIKTCEREMERSEGWR